MHVADQATVAPLGFLRLHRPDRVEHIVDKVRYAQVPRRRKLTTSPISPTFRTEIRRQKGTGALWRGES